LSVILLNLHDDDDDNFRLASRMHKTDKSKTGFG